MSEELPEYEVYRGLQKPFSLFGLKGINVVYGAVGVGGGLVLFIAGYFLFGFLGGLIPTLILLGWCLNKILFHVKNGLHIKEKYEGVWIVKYLIRPTFSGNINKVNSD